MGQRNRRLRWPSPALAVALVALFVSLGGVGIAATGGSFILGHSNSARRTSALRASPTSGAALGIRNATPGLPAVAFRVTGGAPPFTVNSTTEVPNLNAGQLDGLSSAAFEPKADIVRIDAPSMNFNQTQSWNIGPVVTLTASCSTASGVNDLRIDLLNNTPRAGQWFLDDLIYPGDKPQVNPATPWIFGGVIQSGLDQVVAEAHDPPSKTAISDTESHTGTLTWYDTTGEVITVNFVAIAYANYCLFEGTSTRAT